MKKRISAMLLVLLMLFAFIPQAAFAKTGTSVHYSHDFNSAKLSSEWGNDSTGFGMSYATGSWKVVQGNDAISGRTPLFNKADLRWWSVSFKNDTMSFRFDFKVDGNFAGSLQFCVTSQDASTTSEGLSGKAVEITKSGSDYVLKNHKGQTVTKIEEGKHSVEMIFTRASDKYEIKLDGKSVSADNAFKSGVYSIHGMRFQIDAGGTDKYIAVDNFKASSTGWIPPQTYSWQEIGKVPKVTVPTAPEDRIYAYVDKAEVDLSELNAIEVDGVVYLPLDKTLAAANLTSSVGEMGETLVTVGETPVALKADLKTVRIGDSFIELNHAPRTEADVLYVPLQFFAEVLDAKVWHDAASKTVVITTGDYKTDGILRLYNGKFFMNGEIYYEISFNKFDMNMQLNADPTFVGSNKYSDATFNNAESCLAGAEKALKEMSENGFKTIRVFCANINLNKKQSEIDAYFKRVDKMYDLCDQYGIKMVACMSLTTEEFLDGEYVDGTWVTKTESYYDYFTNPDSISRQNAYKFLETYVNRYKDRGTVLMWEICNEGNLGADVGGAIGSATYSLLQLGRFYNDMAKKFHEYDPERLVTGGDGMLRSAQWNLFEGVMKGTGVDWTVDTAYERKKALVLMHEELDVISIHGYDVGYETGNGHGLFTEGSGIGAITRHMKYEDYVAEAFALGKGLYNGETGGQMGKSYANTSANAAKYRKEYLQTLVDAGVQLTHWWTYGSNRNGGFNNDIDTFTVTIEDTPETFAAIKEANEALKAKWIVNAAESENTAKYKNGEFVEYTGTELGEAAKEEEGCGSVMGAFVPTVMMLSLPMMLIRRKRKEA